MKFIFLILSIISCTILVYVSVQLANLSENLEVGKGKKMAEILSLILIVPSILMFIYMISLIDEMFFLRYNISKMIIFVINLLIKLFENFAIFK